MSVDYVDVLIITASAEGLAGVLALGEGAEKAWTKAKDSTGATFHAREFRNKRGRPFSVAAAWANVEAMSKRVEELIAELSPSWVVTCGACTGFATDETLGDLLFAEGILDDRPREHGLTYRPPQSLLLDAPFFLRNFALSPEARSLRPKSIESQERWLLRALHAAKDSSPDPLSHPERRTECPNWAQIIRRLRSAGHLAKDPGTLTLTESGSKRVLEDLLLHPDGPPADAEPNCHTGWIATTEHVERANVLRLEETPLFGWDQSSAIVAEIAHRHGLPWLVIKTIVDFPGRDPFPDYDPYGVCASAECLLHVLQHALSPDEHAGPSLPASRRDLFLESITLHNFKNIHHLDLKLLQPSALAGHWTCIAGLNGAGKSAILQAIAIVLLGDKLATEIGSGWLARARRMDGGAYLPAEIRARVRAGQDSIDLFLPLDENGVNEPHLEADERSYQRMREFWTGRKRNHLLLAYGAGRNLSEHRDSRHKDKNDDVRRQMTLFDPLTQVASVEVLLEQGARAKPILTMLKRLLDAVLVDVALCVEESNDGLIFRCGNAIVPASELPDGFRATIAWLADICATWHEKAGAEAEDGDPSKICGIVLIDEIDLHLHASLQRVLVPRLRRALPNVQWIVTTHSPLVISSFDRREIVLLRAGERGPEQQALDRQILGFTTDEVYEYLMAIEPHSAALEEPFAEGIGNAQMANILAQSPDVNEAKAEEERALLDELSAQTEASRESEGFEDEVAS